MKLAVNKDIARDVLKLQTIYDVTVISDEGLVFLKRDDWVRIYGMLDECSQILANYHARNTLSDKFCFCGECFIVAYDKSEDFSCHAIVNFNLFSLCCRRCNIYLVLLPMWDLVSYVREFNAHYHNNVLGCYTDNNDNVIDVEDN